MSRKKIEIFIGGSTDINSSQKYFECAQELGEVINNRDYNIIFDGCFGFPFVVYLQLKDKYYRLTIFYNEDFGMPVVKQSQIRGFNSQSDTTRAFIKNSDALIFMKGGMGTIAEIAHGIDAKKNREAHAPIVILNINHEWEKLVNLLDDYNIKDLYYVTDNVMDALNYIERELYKEGSYFRKLWLDSGDYMDRKNPIFDTYDKIEKRKYKK